ncbi:urease accessory protein UreF [Limimaricola sp.]|uniref:urease accessory protein UreF n=1 Tax=Limimaricola sp. TaxID=2211665 RepID=UPI004058D0FA
MLTDAQALVLARWLSPAYPVGAFAYSHGLETAIADGHVTDEAGLRDWLADLLEHGAGRNDALFLAAAFRAEEAGELARIDATARAFAASHERVTEAARQGAAFLRTEAAVSGGPDRPLMHPVAIGARAARLDLPLRPVIALYLQGFMANLVSAALRLMPLGQTGGQRVQAALEPLCAALAVEAETGGLDDLCSTAFLGDIASMRHETQQPRIFAT